MHNLPLFIILSVLAEIIGTVGGFGSSLLFVPIAGFFLDFHSVLGITALFHVASNLSKLGLFRKGFDRKLIINIGLPSVLFVLPGAYMSKLFNSQHLQIALAIFLILMSSLLLIFKKLVLKPSLINSVGGGALSGFTAGILGTGGAIRGLTLAAFNLGKEAFIATSAAIDMGVDLSRSLVYVANGFVRQSDLYLVPILVAIGFTGTYIGKWLLGFISEKQFKSVVIGLIFVIGIITLLKQL